jgi:RsiW-degrading membrane proteinase PrsW (M82 family)
MNGLGILLLLILISALPVLAVYIWIRISRFPINLPWFFLALLGGAFSLGIAALLQSFFPQVHETTLGIALFKIFVQIALTEELGRLGILLLFFGLGRRFGKNTDAYTPAYGTIMGLIVGLGFAVIETAAYGVGNFRIALIRAVTAAPLHGACGARIGLGAIGMHEKPGLTLARFLYAVGIHGMYNFMLASPRLPLVFPVLIAFSALISSLRPARRLSH